MRSKDNPNLTIDWDSFNNVDRQKVSDKLMAKGLNDKKVEFF